MTDKLLAADQDISTFKQWITLTPVSEVKRYAPVICKKLKELNIKASDILSDIKDLTNKAEKERIIIECGSCFYREYEEVLPK